MALLIAGWTLAGGGLLLTLWALLWDRPRGRRRCPTCWYDLAGTPGLKCPECGHAARAERALFRTHRRWALAALGLCAAVAAAGLPGIRRIPTEGWTGPIPTTVLIAAMPLLDPIDPRGRLQHLAFIDQGWRGDPLRALANRSRVDDLAPWQRRFMVRCFTWDIGRRPLGSVAWARVEGDILMACPAQAMDDECYSAMADVATVCVTTRSTWPKGLPIYGKVEPYRLVRWERNMLERESLRWSATPLDASLRTFSGVEPPADFRCGVDRLRPWSDSLECLGTPAEAGPVRFEIKAELGQPGGAWRVVCPSHRTGRLQVLDAPEGTEPASLILHPVRSADFERALARPGAVYGMDPRFGRMVALNTRSLAQSLVDLNATFAVRAELRRHGRTMGSTVAWWRGIPGGSGPVVLPNEKGLVFQRPNGSPVDLSEIGGWSVRLRGDPETALRDLESDKYWDGEVEVPVEEIEITALQPL